MATNPARSLRVAAHCGTIELAPRRWTDAAVITGSNVARRDPRPILPHGQRRLVAIVSVLAVLLR
jgi:hypothetical protein